MRTGPGWVQGLGLLLRRRLPTAAAAPPPCCCCCCCCPASPFGWLQPLLLRNNTEV